MIKIAHLYYDLMNLYGDNGNIKILKQALEKQGVETSIEFLSIDDDINFDEFDFIYIGPGTYNNEKIVLRHLLEYKDNVKKAFDNNTFFLITGNSLEMFGNFITDDNKKLEALGIIDFTSEKTTKRLVSEIYAKCDKFDNIILGFKNQDGLITSNEKGFFQIIQGFGFNEESKEDGFLINNFLGTYMIGPILVRNPELLTFLVKRIIDSKYKDFKYKPFDLDFENKAHDEYLKNYFEDSK